MYANTSITYLYKHILYTTKICTLPKIRGKCLEDGLFRKIDFFMQIGVFQPP